MHSLGLTILSLLLLSSCNSDDCRDNAPIVTPVDIQIQRTEKDLLGCRSVEDVEGYLTKYPKVARELWQNYQYPSNTALAQRMFRQLQHPTVRDTVYQQAMNAIDQAQNFESELEEIIGRLKTAYPEAKTPEVYTAVTLFYHDLVASDSIIAISLDYFIGKNASYAPPAELYPEYVLERYDFEHLPSLISFFLAGQFVTPGRDKTLLTEMIDFGKAYYLASRLLPCADDRLIIGYTEQNMEDINANREIIWANFIENQLLYETDHQIKKKFIEERPNVYEISEKCPGRIGLWIGWEIVEEYMKNNGVSIRDLMADTDHHKIFEKSGYKPRNR